MKAILKFVLLFFLGSLPGWAQKNPISLENNALPPQLSEVHVEHLFTDSSVVSSFLIYIKKEVKTHKHLSHSEHVYVLEGSGEMMLGEKTFTITKGDLIFIPKNTFHAVKTISEIPLKVISIQAPFFDGKDRVFPE